MYQIYFYVPVKYKEKVKQSMFEAGGGELGHYAQCSFEVLGLGQFKPLKGSNPFEGQIDIIENVKEFKVEMLVQKAKIIAVIDAMKKAHPYEEVAYGYFEVGQ